MLLRLVLVLLLICGVPTWSHAAKRVALVIGNSAYKHTPKLNNTKNDATDMAAALKVLGFEIVKGIDLDKREMERTIRRFARKLRNAKIGAFFYAGHGIQVNGANYLVPTDAELSTSEALDFEMIRLDVVQRVMENATRTNVIFLDACRDNPLSRNLARALGTRSTSIGRGLAQVEAGLGTLISYATQPGNVAFDGDTRNSPYTAALKRHIGLPGEDLTSVLIRVRNDVIETTSGKQIPWDQSALRSQLFLGEARVSYRARLRKSVLASKSLAELEAYRRLEPSLSALIDRQKQKLSKRVAALEAEASTREAKKVEQAYWETVREAGDYRLLESYINRYPNGTFVSSAQDLIVGLKERAKKEELARQKEIALRAAERKQQQARLERLAAERRVALAQRDSELRKALEVAERTQRELRNAERSRLAAEEAAKKANEEREHAIRKAEEAARARLAALTRENSSKTPKKSGEGTLDRPALVREIQTELTRLGCDPGPIDGQWGAKGRAALSRFAKLANVSVDTTAPDAAVVAMLKGTKQRLCPKVVVKKRRPNSSARSSTSNTSSARSSRSRKSGAACFQFDGKTYCQ